MRTSFCVHAATRHHLLLKVDLLYLPMLERTVHISVRASQCKGKTATAFHLESHNCNSRLFRVLSAEFLIFFCLRSASHSVYEYQLCGDRQDIIPSIQKAHITKQMEQTRFVKYLPAQHVYHLSSIICKYPVKSKE